MVIKKKGTEAVVKKLKIGDILPQNYTEFTRQETPDLTIFPKCSAKIMRYITKRPVIQTEYYTSEDNIDIVDYENDPYLKHSFVIVQNKVRKAVVVIYLHTVTIYYQRQRKIELIFKDKFEAKLYWKALQPERDITFTQKEYLKEIGIKEFKSTVGTLPENYNRYVG